MTLLCKFHKRRLWRRTVEIPQLQTVEKFAGTETSSLRQSAGMLQAREKQPENDVSGRVSESCEHFQFGAQFRDTADELRNTHEHSMRNTCTEHRCRDNTNVTMTTDARSNDDNDEEREQGEQGQGRHQSNTHEIQKQNASNTRTRNEASNGRKHRAIHSLQRENRFARNNQALEESCYRPHRGQIAGWRKEGTEETGQS